MSLPDAAATSAALRWPSICAAICSASSLRPRRPKPSSNPGIFSKTALPLSMACSNFWRS
jgi:hypothetical protein